MSENFVSGAVRESNLSVKYCLEITRNVLLDYIQRKEPHHHVNISRNVFDVQDSFQTVEIKQVH